jgi:hypothetical protein
LYRGADVDNAVRVVFGWMLVEALVWTVLVEVAFVGGEHVSGVVFVVEEYSIGALGSDAADEASAKAFARGVRAGVLTTSMPSAANTASKAVPAENVIPAVQAACSYSFRTSPRRLRRRMFR